jgi:hypothetical protein
MWECSGAGQSIKPFAETTLDVGSDGALQAPTGDQAMRHPSAGSVVAEKLK